MTPTTYTNNPRSLNCTRSTRPKLPYRRYCSRLGATFLFTLLSSPAAAGLSDTFTLDVDTPILRIDYTGTAKRGSIDLWLTRADGTTQVIDLYDRLWGRCDDTFCFQSYTPELTLPEGSYSFSLTSTSDQWTWSGTWALIGFGLPEVTIASGNAQAAPDAAQAVPEPETMGLIGLGLLALGMARRQGGKQ